MFNLRYYQDELIAAAHEKWQTNQSTAIIAATGTGKTEMFLHIAVSEPGRVCILVHRDYLISSPIDRLRKAGFDDVAVEKAELKSERGHSRARSKVVFASVQSLSKPARLETFDPFQFTLLIIDEAHRAVAASYVRVLEHFKKNAKIKILLLTATPKRKDGIALGNVCDSVAGVYSPSTAAAEGWIVPVKFWRREVESLDFSNVRMKGGDLDTDQVEALMKEEGPLHEVCATLAEDRGPTLVFCPGVAVAQAYSAVMNNRYRYNRSAVLWADSDDDERTTAGKKLLNGDIDYIFNCDLYTEGYDVPYLERIVWAAPTASLNRYTQGCGRVFRPHPSLRDALSGGREDAAARRLMIQQSPKPIGKIVTYYPQNCRHQLCDPIDILGGDDLAADVKMYARVLQDKTASLPGGSDTGDDLSSAQDVSDLRSACSERLRELKAKATYSDHEYDAMGGTSNRMSGQDTKRVRKSADEITASWGNGKPLSDKQAGWFKWKGHYEYVKHNMTALRAWVVRDLIESGMTFDAAISVNKGWGMKLQAQKKAERERN